MAKCIGNCPACELDVDKVICCTFQSLKQTLLLRSEVNELKMKVLALQVKDDSEKSVSLMDIAEPDAPGAAEE